MKQTKGKGNPYHDETGRFCSAGEMRDAIERLKQAGNVEGYFELRKEYEAAQNNTVEVPAEFIDKAMTSGSMYENSKNPKIVELVYNHFKDGKPTRSSNYNNYDHPDFFVEVNLFKNPATSEEIKQELLENATPMLKRFILEKTSNVNSTPNLIGKVDANQIKTMLKGEKKAETLKIAMQSEVLTLEEKREILAGTEAPSVYASYAYYNQKEIFSSPEYSEELYNKTRQIVDNAADKNVANKNVRTLLCVLADSDNQKYLNYTANSLEEDNYSLVSRYLFDNENVSHELAKNVLAQGLFFTNKSNFDEVAQHYHRNKSSMRGRYPTKNELLTFEAKLPAGVLDKMKDRTEIADLHNERYKTFNENMKAYNVYKRGEYKSLRRYAERNRGSDESVIYFNATQFGAKLERFFRVI
jgi:hypothetical protein